jgi:hypothetical protein
MGGPTRDNYRTDRGVQLTGAQVQSFRQFVGLSMPWARTFSWNKEQWKDALDPFFFGGDQEWYHQIATWQLGDRNADLIGTRPEIRKATHGILMHVVERVADGEIFYDKYASRLKTHHHPKCNCKIVLYDYLTDYINSIEAQIATCPEPEKYEDDLNQLYYNQKNLEKFQSKWENDMEKEMELCVTMLQSGVDNESILEKIQKMLTPQDPLLLDGKIRKLRTGNYRFENTEDLQTEYKQSMFSPDCTKIDETSMTSRAYNKQVAGKKNDLINEVCSSVCAFCNTNDGSIYIGVDDDSRNVIGLSDDKNSKKFKDVSYTKFQEKYKIAIMNELQKRTIRAENQPLDLDKYVNGIRYHGPYGEDDIDIIEIPCKKILSSESPVWLKNKLDIDGNPIKGGEQKLYWRVMKNSGSDDVVPENQKIKFYKKYFKEWHETL